MRTKTYREDIEARFTGKRGKDNQLRGLVERLEELLRGTNALHERMTTLGNEGIARGAMLLRIEELLTEDPTPEPGPLYWFEGIGVVNLRACLSLFAQESEGNRSLAFDKQPDGCKTAARAFVDWLSDRYSDVRAVNDMWDRHCYAEPDLFRHADAFVVMPDLANPSRDFIIDFVSGVSEPGVLGDNLQHNVTSKKPWRVGNAFEEGCE